MHRCIQPTLLFHPLNNQDNLKNSVECLLSEGRKARSVDSEELEIWCKGDCCLRIQRTSLPSQIRLEESIWKSTQIPAGPSTSGKHPEPQKYASATDCRDPSLKKVCRFCNPHKASTLPSYLAIPVSSPSVTSLSGVLAPLYANLLISPSRFHSASTWRCEGRAHNDSEGLFVFCFDAHIWLKNAFDRAFRISPSSPLFAPRRIWTMIGWWMSLPKLSAAT